MGSANLLRFEPDPLVSGEAVADGERLQIHADQVLGPPPGSWRFERTTPTVATTTQSQALRPFSRQPVSSTFAVRSAKHAVGQGTATDRLAKGTTQAMELLFVYLRPDQRQLDQMMAPRLGIIVAEGITALATLRQFAVGDRATRSCDANVHDPLPASAFLRQRLGRLPLDADRVGRQQPGAFGGVLVEASLRY